MSDKEFKKGDLVQLRSGGPVMTVRNIGRNEVECTWFDKNENPQEKTFKREQLNKYTPPKGGGAIKSTIKV